MSTTTLITTSTVLAPADCLMPITSSAATSATMAAAGRLNTPGTREPSAAAAVDPGAAVSAGGSDRPRSRRKLTK